MKNIVIFSSGSGTNTERIIQYFANHEQVKVKAVFTNNAKAGVIDKVRKYYIPVYLFSRHEFYNTEIVLDEIKKLNTDLIVLAGFLWLIPENLIVAFPDKILNIHPALLPKFGGKGMYGKKVHNAVLESQEKKSGISIHLVNKVYDDGKILAQFDTKISEKETPESLAKKVQKLEHKHYPQVIEQYLFQTEI